jgi:hypothetical protein
MSTWGALSLGCLIGLVGSAIAVLLALSFPTTIEDSPYQVKIVQALTWESQEKSFVSEVHPVKKEEPIQPSEPLVADDLSQSSEKDIPLYAVRFDDALWSALHCLNSRPANGGIRLLSLPPQRIVIDERLTESKKNTMRTTCYEPIEINILR